MAAKQDHPPAAGDSLIEVIEAACFDPARGAKHADMAQMRVLRGDPAEIVPHAAQDPFDLRRGKLRQSGA